MNSLGPRSLPWALLGLLSVPLAAHADDWPQWRGPSRDGVWREEGVLERLTKGQERVLCLDEATGKILPVSLDARPVE